MRAISVTFREDGCFRVWSYQHPNMEFERTVYTIDGVLDAIYTPLATKGDAA